MLNKNDIVLVTGGTGFTGTVLVKQLCELGCEVRVIARPTSNTALLEKQSVKIFSGNVYDEEIIKDACQGVNYIFHVAASFREASIADEVYWNVHVKSTQLLAQHAIKQMDFKRFIHVSTVGVHGHIENPPANEESAFSPGDVYQKTKVEGELWIRDFAKQQGMGLTVVRPAAIYGPGDKRLLKLFKMAKLPVVPVLGFTKGLYHLIHVEDLAAFMITAATHANTVGQVYICGNPESTSIKEIIKIVADYLGKSPPFIRLPAWPFFLLGDLCETVCRKFSIEPPIYRRRVAFFTKDRSFDTRKMAEHTNYVYRFTNKTGIIDTAKGYIKQGWM